MRPMQERRREQSRRVPRRDQRNRSVDRPAPRPASCAAACPAQIIASARSAVARHGAGVRCGANNARPPAATHRYTRDALAPITSETSSCWTTASPPWPGTSQRDKPLGARRRAPPSPIRRSRTASDAIAAVRWDRPRCSRVPGAGRGVLGRAAWSVLMHEWSDGRTPSEDRPVSTGAASAGWDEPAPEHECLRRAATHPQQLRSTRPASPEVGNPFVPPVAPQALAVTTLVTTSIPSSSSNPSKEPRNLDDLDAPGSIYTPGSRLRALWTEWSVEVRVLSGALGKPRKRDFLRGRRLRRRAARALRRACFAPHPGSCQADMADALAVPDTGKPSSAVT